MVRYKTMWLAVRLKTGLDEEANNELKSLAQLQQAGVTWSG